MENEIMEEIIPEVSPDPVETETYIPVPETDILPDQETVEDVPPSSEDVSENEDIPDSPILEETQTPEELPETEIEEETGETENETAEIMDAGNETNTGSLSDNDIGNGGNASDDTELPYTMNYYVETTETVPLWENNISNFSTSEMLLFLIFLLLLVQFIHNIFKGSHFLKR